MKRTIAVAAMVVLAAAATIPALRAQSGAEAQKAVDAAYAKFRTLKEG